MSEFNPSNSAKISALAAELKHHMAKVCDVRNALYNDYGCHVDLTFVPSLSSDRHDFRPHVEVTGTVKFLGK